MTELVNMLTIGYVKKKICYDFKHAQIKKMYISDIPFLTLCHRDFTRRIERFITKQKQTKYEY